MEAITDVVADTPEDLESLSLAPGRLRWILDAPVGRVLDTWHRRAFLPRPVADGDQPAELLAGELAQVPGAMTADRASFTTSLFGDVLIAAAGIFAILVVHLVQRSAEAKAAVVADNPLGVTPPPCPSCGAVQVTGTSFCPS